MKCVALLERRGKDPFSQSSRMYTNEEDTQTDVPHLKKCTALLEKVRNEGVFDKFPEKFFLFQLFLKNLKSSPRIKKLSPEEQAEVLLLLLKRLSDSGAYSSLYIATNLVQDQKPEILLSNDPHFFIECYKIVITGIEKYTLLNESRITMLEGFAKNALNVHFFTNRRQIAINKKQGGVMYAVKPPEIPTESLPKKIIDEQSTNPLIKTKKTSKWQQACAEINKELFLALCRQEIRLKDNLNYVTRKRAQAGKEIFEALSNNTGKNIAESVMDLQNPSELKLSKAISHLTSACEMHQFDEQYDTYLECLSFLTTLSLSMLGDSKEFTIFGKKICHLLFNFTPKPYLDDEIKKMRFQFVKDWGASLEHDQQATLILADIIARFDMDMGRSIIAKK
jgi:hypothetical protein